MSIAPYFIHIKQIYMIHQIQYDLGFFKGTFPKVWPNSKLMLIRPLRPAKEEKYILFNFDSRRLAIES